MVHRSTLSHARRFQSTVLFSNLAFLPVEVLVLLLLQISVKCFKLLTYKLAEDLQVKEKEKNILKKVKHVKMTGFTLSMWKS